MPVHAPLDRIFRRFHSMEGSAGFLGFGQIERVTHHAETLLDGVRKGQVRFSPAGVALSLLHFSEPTGPD